MDDLSERDPVKEAKMIISELKKYDDSLYKKPRWIVLNKTDLNYDVEKLKKNLKDSLHWDDRIFNISALTGNGCKELVNAIAQFIEN